MSELPRGWVSTNLSDIGRWSSGGTPSRGRAEYFGQGIPWIKSGDLPDGLIQGTEEQISELGLKNSSAKLMPSGTISIALYGATIGKLGVLTFPAATNQACANVNPDSELIDPQYLFFYLLSERQTLIEKGQGGAQPNISQEIIKSHPITIAPLNEQRRIVAKLEKLLTRVDAAQDRLATIPHILRRFRQSVLAAACSGRLTADWRKEHSNIDPASLLVERINKRRGSSAHVEILALDESPGELPSTWLWARFGSVIGELRNGISTKPSIDPPGTPILRISATRPGRVDLNEVRYLRDANNFLPSCSLAERDLLFTRYNGSLELLGVCGMVRGIGKKVLLYPDKLMRVRFDHDFVLPQYAELFFRAEDVHDRVIAKSKSSAGQNGVSGSDIKAQPFAVPPLAEQQEIVRCVEALFKTADALEARCRTAKTHVDKLTQSILAKAFRGELIPQDPRDEPASVLLGRIRERKHAFDRETIPKTRGSRKRVLTESRN